MLFRSNLRGVAQDDVGIASVLVSLNGGAPVAANLTAGALAAAKSFAAAKPTDPVHWNLDVSPENGNNVVVIQSMDTGGNLSAPRTIRFHYAVARPEIAGLYTGLATPTGRAKDAARRARRM